jgi:hypothetical protein
VEPSNISPVDSQVVDLPKRPARAPRARPAARVEPARRARGRVWINGREVGGVDPRFAHLGKAHD